MDSTVSYRTEFEAAYVERGNLNAHRYKIEVTVAGDSRYEQAGRIIDYNTLAIYVKDICPNQCWILGSEATDQELQLAETFRQIGIPVWSIPYPTSIERMCQGLADELQDTLNRHESGVHVIEVKLRDTSDSYATWRA